MISVQRNHSSPIDMFLLSAILCFFIISEEYIYLLMSK